MLGVGDKAGSGIDKIRDSWKSLHWQSPRLEETQRPDRVVLALPLISMLPENVLTGLAARFGTRLRALDKDSVQVLATAQMEGSVSNHRLQETLTLHRRDITSLLQSLVREGFLVPDGVGRGTHYELGMGNGPPETVPVPPDSLLVPPDKPVIPPDKGALPLEEALLVIAAPVRSTRRADPAVTRSTILTLCRGRFLSLRELSELLDRGSESLRNGFISPMVKDGALELRYPDKPSRRDQAYRSRQGA